MRSIAKFLWVAAAIIITLQAPSRAEPEPLTIQIVAHQWYWQYIYPDYGSFSFDSHALHDPGQEGQTADNPLVLPAGRPIHIMLTGADVIHGFFVPQAGIRRYAIPGKTIEYDFKIDLPGTAYGQCNTLCGEGHNNMPIVITAVEEAEFQAWVETARKKFTSAKFPSQAPLEPRDHAAMLNAAAPIRADILKMHGRIETILQAERIIATAVSVAIQLYTPWMGVDFRR